MIVFTFNILEHGSGNIIQNENISGDIYGNTCTVLSITNFGNGLSSITLSEDLLDSNVTPNVYVKGEKITGLNSGSIAFVKNIPTLKTLDISNTKIITNVSAKPKNKSLSSAEKLSTKFLSSGQTLQFVNKS